jgi:hypothetical protein
MLSFLQNNPEFAENLKVLIFTKRSKKLKLKDKIKDFGGLLETKF